MSTPVANSPSPATGNSLVLKRQQLVLIAICVAAVLVAYMIGSAGSISTGLAHSEQGDFSVMTPDRAINADDAWRGRAEVDLAELRAGEDELRRSLDDLASRIDVVITNLNSPEPADAFSDSGYVPQFVEYDQSPSPDILLPQYEHNESAYVQPVVIEPDPVVTPAIAAAVFQAPQDDAPASDNEDHSESRHVSRYLPAGAFVEAVLIGSLDAPTGNFGSSNPHPVLLSLSSAAKLPNSSRFGIDGCFVIGAGYGDIASERVYVRTERISCVATDGEISDVPAKGYVAGEDGKTGLRGRMVTKQGHLLARSLAAGFFSGLGEIYHDRFSTVRSLAVIGGGAGDSETVRSYESGSEFKAGLASGAASSLEKLSDYYLEMADRIHPVIEIAAGRKVDIVFQEGIDFGSNLGHSAEDPLGEWLALRFEHGREQ